MQERFPEIAWSITAGNSSQLADGAAAVLLASEAMAARLNLTPRARFVAFDVIGDDPIMMLTAPIASTRRVLAKAGNDHRRHGSRRGQRGVRVRAAGLEPRISDWIRAA